MAISSTYTASLLVQSMYNERGRFYHDINHLKFMSAKLSEYNKEQPNSRFNELVVELTQQAVLWHDFHYSIWEPVGTNEAQSASAFLAAVHNGTVISEHDEYTSAVVGAILATANHTKQQTWENVSELHAHVCQLTLDLDLASLGLHPNAVIYNNHNVCKEMEPLGLSPEQIATRQLNFFKGLAARPRIFYTDYFYNKYEAIARGNIDSLMVDLDRQIPKPIAILPKFIPASIQKPNSWSLKTALKEQDTMSDSAKNARVHSTLTSPNRRPFTNPVSGLKGIAVPSEFYKNITGNVWVLYYYDGFILDNCYIESDDTCWWEDIR